MGAYNNDVPADWQWTDSGLATVGLDALPSDAQERVDLINVLTDGRRTAVARTSEPHEDGDLVLVEVLLQVDDDELHETLLEYFGDVRCLDRAGSPLLQVRFFRDGRRRATDAIIRAGETWPSGDAPIAVDFDCVSVEVETWLSQLRQAATAGEQGREVYFVNVPSHLRVQSEVTEGDRVELRRRIAGPLLPRVLRQHQA